MNRLQFKKLKQGDNVLHNGNILKIVRVSYSINHGTFPESRDTTLIELNDGTILQPFINAMDFSYLQRLQLIKGKCNEKR